jgi:hypothetical protein
LAGVLAVVAVATSGDCRDSPAGWLIVGSGIVSTGATFLSLNRRMRRSVALFVALVLGALITGVLLVIGIGSWVGHCTAWSCCRLLGELRHGCADTSTPAAERRTSPKRRRDSERADRADLRDAVRFLLERTGPSETTLVLLAPEGTYHITPKGMALLGYGEVSGFQDRPFWGRARG